MSRLPAAKNESAFVTAVGDRGASVEIVSFWTSLVGVPTRVGLGLSVKVHSVVDDLGHGENDQDTFAVAPSFCPMLETNAERRTAERSRAGIRGTPRNDVGECDYSNQLRVAHSPSSHLARTIPIGQRNSLGRHHSRRGSLKLANGRGPTAASHASAGPKLMDESGVSFTTGKRLEHRCAASNIAIAGPSLVRPRSQVRSHYPDRSRCQVRSQVLPDSQVRPQRLGCNLSC